MANSSKEDADTTLWPSFLLARIEDDYGRETLRATRDCEDLIKTNDSAGSYTEPEREAKIAAIFAKHGVDVVFK